MRARPARRSPDLKLGICGEHGGDPASIAFCERVGLDYVSCSPYRVPIARLAAAQAALAARGTKLRRIERVAGRPLDALRAGGKRAMALALARIEAAPGERRDARRCSMPPTPARAPTWSGSPARRASASRPSSRA